jgi:hypothetical protein
MNDEKMIEYIKNAGGCVITKSLLYGQGKLKWILREDSVDPKVDTGWRFFSDIDDSDYVNDPDNLIVCDFNTIANIEPAILGIYGMPAGTDLQLVIEKGKKLFYDNLTEKQVEISDKLPWLQPECSDAKSESSFSSTPLNEADPRV